MDVFSGAIFLRGVFDVRAAVILRPPPDLKGKRLLPVLSKRMRKVIIYISRRLNLQSSRLVVPSSICGFLLLDCNAVSGSGHGVSNTLTESSGPVLSLLTFSLLLSCTWWTLGSVSGSAVPIEVDCLQESISAWWMQSLDITRSPRMESSPSLKTDITILIAPEVIFRTTLNNLEVATSFHLIERRLDLLAKVDLGSMRTRRLVYRHAKSHNFVSFVCSWQGWIKVYALYCKKPSRL